MRSPLLPEVEAESPAHMREHRPRRRLRLRGGDGDEVVAVGGGAACCCVCLFVMFNLFWKGLDPNVYGIKRNSINGQIEDKYYRGGLYLLGPFTYFVQFPATLSALEFSAHSSNGYPVEARTGAVDGDQDSGGQPITISCTVQYKFLPSKLRQVILTFGTYEAALARYYSFAKMAITSQAQHFSPQDFWQKRQAITMDMLEAVNKTLVDQGYVEAIFFQILKIDFTPKYERSITKIQVAEQQRVINENEQQVQIVTQHIRLMNSTNQAHISNISSYANAHAKEIVAQAKQKAFEMTQGAKATNYKHLKKTLGFGEPQMKEYFKIKAVQATGASPTGNVVVGLENPGSHLGGAGDRRLLEDEAEAMANIDWGENEL